MTGSCTEPRRMAAGGKGYPEIVRALLAAKADVNARTGDGRTALLFAAQGRQKETVQLLKAPGAVGQ